MLTQFVSEAPIPFLFKANSGSGFHGEGTSEVEARGTMKRRPDDGPLAKCGTARCLLPFQETR